MKDETIFEYMMHRLKEIQKEKIWSDEKMGFSFAELLIAEPKQIVMQRDFQDNSYYDEEPI